LITLIFNILLFLAQFLALFANRFNLLQNLVVFEIFQSKANINYLSMVGSLMLGQMPIR